MPVGALVEVENITVKYGRVTAVDGLSFSIEPGEVVGLLGPNGSGKTSTIKSIAALVEPVEGQVTVNGFDTRRQYRQVAMSAAVMLEGERNLYWRLTARENLEYFAALQGMRRTQVGDLIDELLQRFSLDAKAKTEVRQLSRGMKQKLALACAVVRQTPLLLLDEPTLGLDVETSMALRLYLIELSRASNKTLLVSSHDLRVVEAICPRVIVITQGRLIADDRVETLRTLFSARSYTVTLGGRLDSTAAKSLGVRFGARYEASDDGRSRIQADLPDSAALYGLIDALRAAQCEIDAIDRAEPNLESIYLRLVEDSSR